MPSPNPTWYFLVLTTTLGILATGVVYVIGANLLNWLIPGTVGGLLLQLDWGLTTLSMQEHYLRELLMNGRIAMMRNWMTESTG